MIKHLKSNKIITLFLFIICIIMILKPLTYAKCFLNGISVWALKVLPLLFPFFVLSKLIVQLSNRKPFNSSFKSSILTFLLSCLSGYPMGAKLILEQCKAKQLSSSKAKTMMAFCSVSGPMFMIGSVGIGFLCSYSAGIIILFSNILGAIFNGLIWNKINKKHSELPVQNKAILATPHTKNFSFSDIVYDSLISILMVGSYIALSFVLIEICEQTHIINFLSRTIYFLSCKSVDIRTIESFIIGLIEITSGIFNLAQTQSSLIVKTIISAFLVSFGGVSILLQNWGIISEIGISWKYILKQKISHSIFSILIACLLCFCFML